MPTPVPAPLAPPVVCVSPAPLPPSAQHSTTPQRTGARRLRSLHHFNHIYVVAHVCISPLTLLAGYLLESLVVYLALLACFYDMRVPLMHKMASAAAVHLYLHHSPQEVVLLAITLLVVIGAYQVSERGQELPQGDSSSHAAFFYVCGVCCQLMDVFHPPVVVLQVIQWVRLVLWLEANAHRITARYLKRKLDAQNGFKVSQDTS